MASFARLERAALCETARTVGPTAPTLCDGWAVRELIRHMLVRERRPWAAVGILVPAFETVTQRAAAAYDGVSFETMLDQLAEPPLLLKLDAAERLMNGVEFFVHHEDIRRAQPSWTTRDLPADGAADLWRAISLLGRMAARRAGVPLVVTDGSHTATLRAGEGTVVLKGPVSELVLFLTGRRQLAGLEWSGPADQVERLKSANLSL